MKRNNEKAIENLLKKLFKIREKRLIENQLRQSNSHQYSEHISSSKKN